MWCGDARLARWSADNGFGVEREYSRDWLDELTPKTSGLYIFEAENHEAYIGISTDLRARLGQHSRLHGDIRAFRVREMAGNPMELRTVERKLVHDAQRNGLILRNREHAMTLTGESVFDDVMAPAEQSAWLRDPSGVNAADLSSPPPYDSNHLAAHASSFARLQQHPRSSEVIDAVGAYLRACVPVPVRTEGTFWTISCIPGSSRARLTCISMAMLETFYVWSPPNEDRLEVRMFVDGSRIPKSRLPRKGDWRRLGPGVKLGPRAHKSAGVHERVVVIDDVSRMSAALAIAGVVDAAAHHALAVMRQRQSNYKISHCPQLAAAATVSADDRETVPVPVQEAVERSTADFILADGVEDTAADAVPNEVPSAVDSSRQQTKVDKFLRLDSDGSVLRWLGEFIESAVPDSFTDAGVNWGVTCVPSTKSGPGSQRLFTVNVGAMEVAYVRAATRPAGENPTVTVVVSRSALEADSGLSIDELAQKYPSVSFTNHGYVAAAGDDISLTWPLGGVDDVPWQFASGVLVDALRGSRSPYRRYHSPALHKESLAALE
ncbi:MULTISPECIES: GIY-YIG nuclease family protein [Nocardiaceae]|uniref:GIY-YIG nuclease family protein n=1 Tax=Rhodococcoides kroppenstedtii TaxID=293050 RepID=A0ABS7NQA1_9NOCA|nr:MULTISPECIES: GIY-YIG nuclease family protein [Rhodococcus]AMY18034.1 hypothetical protein A3Q40_00626 [Rhodococcus sp. PBTS 1]MBY6313630.1 GIY-YIG nuclease family protein [Rhodococcus kroppenstedtii]MBY6319947.1 GIY-YIG nuclease family protein [Rhodococcus kroppenstedtii]MBY6398886.1 GIY-YIG nuclease family protein [Rhodococcus kroppenstedtii]